MTEWNKAQLRVLESLNEDKNILVSAAAGSGKTAVLVERIIRRVMENKCDIDELLVVTFTRAAAAQMKAKVIKALEDVCEKGEDPSMVKQLALAENADITTIDSFCNRVVRDNFSLIGITDYFNILKFSFVFRHFSKSSRDNNYFTHRKGMCRTYLYILSIII